MGMADEIAKAAGLQAQSRRMGAEFLRTELDVSLTFAEEALSAGDDSEKRERNRANARHGYDTIMRMSEKLANPDTGPDSAEKLHRLKTLLRVLGEEV